MKKTFNTPGAIIDEYKSTVKGVIQQQPYTKEAIEPHFLKINKLLQKEFGDILIVEGVMENETHLPPFQLSWRFKTLDGVLVRREITADLVDSLRKQNAKNK